MNIKIKGVVTGASAKSSLGFLCEHFLKIRVEGDSRELEIPVTKQDWENFVDNVQQDGSQWKELNKRFFITLSTEDILEDEWEEFLKENKKRLLDK